MISSNLSDGGAQEAVVSVPQMDHVEVFPLVIVGNKCIRTLGMEGLSRKRVKAHEIEVYQAADFQRLGFKPAWERAGQERGRIPTRQCSSVFIYPTVFDCFVPVGRK